MSIYLSSPAPNSPLQNPSNFGVTASHWLLYLLLFFFFSDFNRMDALSLMRGDAFIHFVSGSRRVNIRFGVLLLIPKSPQDIHLIWNYRKKRKKRNLVMWPKPQIKNGNMWTEWKAKFPFISRKEVAIYIYIYEAMLSWRRRQNFMCYHSCLYKLNYSGDSLCLNFITSLLICKFCC